ncbi:thiol:disulfide interchange protein DsbD [Thiosulfatimonas sediminis]|uniref:Thiol:disulfide interchange protein DsbD n=1 Tax=Thiosulfatimonas sediminis TaxID=2675054 RepID=A0A6F8PX98_9GAMM|nr:protein-disulfide reductase DsbD [Thiosulfatimonas sediminis]BBP46667.1 thiol:disulfide interchange protein DsbD [Thiosulfatimonas sediminis]
MSLGVAFNHKIKNSFVLFFTLWALIANAITPVYADELLEIDQAFALQTPTVIDGKININWKIADDYKLYKDKISVSASQVTLDAIQYSPAKSIDDPLFGKTEVYAHSAMLKIGYQGAATNSEITIKYQGCATSIGVCYPPQERKFTIALPTNQNTATTSNPAAFSSLQALNNFLAEGSGQAELLQADEAFKFSGVQNGKQLNLEWQIAEDYHLYRDKIKVKVTQGDADIDALQLPKATEIDDPLFGKTAVYHGLLQASLAIRNTSQDSVVEIEYQGCSAASGVCYPPTRKTVTISAAAFNNGAALPKLATATVGAEQNSTQQLSETDLIADTLKNSSVWIVILTFFVFGLLLSLTPCIFPMIPILSSIIVGQGDQLTTRRAFIMSLVYVLAMSITYTVAGVLAGVFGENLQAAFQNPWIIGSFSVVFLLLALSMFGFYELQLPSSVQSKLATLSNKQQGGTLTGVAIMGFLSALIVGPCVAPPLAGALIYIGQTGDALLGGVALFAMSIGMGMPLLLLGTSAGKLMPRAGAWMDAVKAVFGVMLIGVAIWMASRILPAEVTMFAWSLLLISSAVYLGAFNSTADKSGWFKLYKGLGLMMFLYGAILLIGMLAGSKDTLQPLKVFQNSNAGGQLQSDKLPFEKIKSSADLDAILAQGKPVMLDFYADWCVSCKEMEQFTFSDQKVQRALEGVTLLKADVTANDDLDKALMKRFGIIGPPAILFFENGQEHKAQRVVGFKNADDFSQTIQRAFTR